MNVENPLATTQNTEIYTLRIPMTNIVNALLEVFSLK